MATKDEPFRVLCIDGGGIRGIIPAVWLRKLELRLRAEKSRSSLVDCFDLVCGTSTGAIVAAALATGESMTSVVNLFRREGPEIFRRSILQRTLGRFIPASGVLTARYRHHRLQAALHSVLGDKELRSLASPRIRLCIPAYDIGDRFTLIFRSWHSDYNETEIWKACLASSSAPTYFPVFRTQINGQERYLVDGGVAANNPCGLGLAEALSILKKDSLKDTTRPVELISLGTGGSTRDLARDLRGNKGAIAWSPAILDVLFHGTSSVSAKIAERVLDNDRFVRLQFELKPGRGSDDLDDASAENMNKLAAAAEVFIQEEGRAQFERIITMLKRPKPNAPRRPRGDGAGNVVPISPPETPPMGGGAAAA